MCLGVVACQMESWPGFRFWVIVFFLIVAVAGVIYSVIVLEKRRRKEEAGKVQVVELVVLNIALRASNAIVELRDKIAEASSSRGQFPNILLVSAESHMIELNNADLTSFSSVDMLVHFVEIRTKMEIGISSCKEIRLSGFYGGDEIKAKKDLDEAVSKINNSLFKLAKVNVLTNVPRNDIWNKGWFFTTRTRLEINLFSAIFILVVACSAPFVVNEYFSRWKPQADSPGQWLERSAAIVSVLSLLVITLMDECLELIRQFRLSSYHVNLARIVKGLSFLIAIAGTIVWGYGSVIFYS